MLVFTPLRRKPIAMLWLGQVLSNVGDEIYNVALVWIAVSLIGNDAGYLSALQAASIFVVGLLGGAWAERWNHGRTMVAVDVLRGCVVLLLPLAAWYGHLTLWVLVPVALVVSSASALFLPALQASLPLLADEERLLTATNALMGTTTRLARILGPAVVALLSGAISTVNVFTVDGLSFFCSALSIATLRHRLQHQLPTITRRALRDLLSHTSETLNALPMLRFLLLTSGVVAAAWWMVFPLGMSLLVHESMGGRLEVLGWLVAAYGVGNLGSNLVVASITTRRPQRLVFAGRFIAGTGFVCLALAPSLPLMLASSALAAIGGPMTDLGLLAILALGRERVDIARVVRLSMCLDYGCLVVGMLAAPRLFAALGASCVIGLCGLILMAIALLGFIKHLHTDPAGHGERGVQL
jgi:hypothetical protein